MAINPCTKFTRCDCSPGVFRTNFSAEQPDPAEFFAIVFDQIIPHLGDPDTYWTNIAQPGVCTAPTLQEAQDCARRQGNDAIVENWIDPHRNPVVLFGNAAQSCTIPCPTGPAFTYTVEAGTFTARTQDEADTLAASYCYTRALAARHCNPVVPVVPPTIIVIDLKQVWGLSEAGYVAGKGLTNLAAYYNGALVITETLGGAQGAALGVNDNLEVVGQAFDLGNVNDNGFWDDGAIRDLGSTTGSSITESISSDGFATFRDNGAITQSYLYDPVTFAFTSLGFLGGGSRTIIGDPAVFSQEKTINSSHQIAASCRDAAVKDLAARYSGVLVDITPAASGGDNSFSIAIDEAGAILGEYLSIALGVNRGFVNVSGGPANSIDIGGVGNLEVFPQSMSRSNRIVCGYCNDGTADTRSFRWNPTDGFLAINRLSPGIGDQAYDCNSHGDIVGQNNNNEAWLCRNGITYSLMSILTAWSLDPLWTALGNVSFVNMRINDNRQIAGIGVYAGLDRAYLFTIPDGAELGPPPP